MAAEHFGACGFVSIVFEAASPAACDRYAGRFQLDGWLDDDAWRLVALAGTIAELIDADQPAHAIAARIESGEARLSSSDRLLARGFRVEHVEACIALLRRRWHELRERASERAAQVEHDHRAAGWWADEAGADIENARRA